MLAAGAALAVFLVSASLPARSQDGEKPTIIRSPTIEIPIEDATEGSVDILLDDLQINSFARFSPGAITITLPFDEQTAPFVITVVTRGDREERFRQRYSLPASSMYDTLDAEGTFQNDTVWKFHSNARPRPEQFDRKDVANDFRAAGKVTATRGRWSATIDGEVVGTDDSKKRLRPQTGDKTDLTRGVGVLDFRGEGTHLQGALGDVSIEPGLELVNQGFSSRGFRVSTRFFDERLEINGGNTFGFDIRGTRHGIDGFRQDNRRTAINLIGRPVQTEYVNVALHGSWFEAIRPSGNSFGFGEVPDGEENEVVGAGIRLGILDNRVQIASQIARSEYANPAELNTFNEFGQSVDVGVTSGDAHTHRADVDIWRGDALSVRGHASYQFVDALYRSIQSFTTADRETWDYGLTATYDIVTATIGKNVFDNNVDDIDSILKTRQRTYRGNLEFALDRFRGTEDQAFGASGNGDGAAPETKKTGGILAWLRRAIPSSLQFSASRDRVKALNADTVGNNSSINGSEIPNQVTWTRAMTASWSWPFGSTSLSLSETRLDTRQTGRETADTEDRSASLDQSFQLGPVSTSFRVGIGDSENADITSRSSRDRMEAGTTIRADFADLPIISAGFDVSRETERFHNTGTEALTNSWRVNGSLDFSKYLPRFDTSVEPYLTLNVTVDETDRRDPNVPSQTVTSYAASMAFGFRF